MPLLVLAAPGHGTSLSRPARFSAKAESIDLSDLSHATERSFCCRRLRGSDEDRISQRREHPSCTSSAAGHSHAARTTVYGLWKPRWPPFLLVSDTPALGCWSVLAGLPARELQRRRSQDHAMRPCDRTSVSP